MKPEIVGNSKIIYSIWRADMAEALIVPIQPRNKTGDANGENKENTSGSNQAVAS